VGWLGWAGPVKSVRSRQVSQVGHIIRELLIAKGGREGGCSKPKEGRASFSMNGHNHALNGSRHLRSYLSVCLSRSSKGSFVRPHTRERGSLWLAIEEQMSGWMDGWEEPNSHTHMTRSDMQEKNGERERERAACGRRHCVRCGVVWCVCEFLTCRLP